MVHRHVAAARGLVLAVALLAISAAPALGANHRVAISNYRWSTPEIQVNAGEHVTWYWTGPDLMHSVTGQSDNAKGWDSDPNINQPDHRLGDSYQVTFDQPGVYFFQCKLHGSVKGEIVVSPTPGDPVTEPDPVPRSNVDVTAPRINDLRLGRRAARHGQKLAMRFSLGEKASLTADFYRYRPRGGGRNVYAGFQRLGKAYIGWNQAGIAGPSKHFRARPGRYLAVIRATDGAANESRPKRLRLRILPRRR